MWVGVSQTLQVSSADDGGPVSPFVRRRRVGGFPEQEGIPKQTVAVFLDVEKVFELHYIIL